MPAISLFGLGIAAKSPTVTAKLMTNFYAESRPQGEKSMLVAHGTPGLELFCDVGAPARGALEFEKNSVAYVVAGGTLWEIDGNGDKVNRGTLATTTSRVSMAHNGVQVMMVDGAHGYIYNTETVVFSQITDTDFPLNPTTVTYLSRRFICSFLDSSRFYVSEIDDGLEWDALMFANAEANPDPIMAVWASTGQLVLLGAVTTEFWGNSGALDFPFVALQGAANEWGIAALSSIAKYDNTFACLIKNRMGQVMVAQMNGYLPKKISTIDIDHIINAYLANVDAWAYSYMLGGHPFYVISFPSAGRTRREGDDMEPVPVSVLDPDPDPDPGPGEPELPACPAWIQGDLSINQDWRNVAWNGTVFCTVPHNHRGVGISPTGEFWTAGALSLPWASNGGITWNGNVFCTAGYSGVSTTHAMTSATGAPGTWSAYAMPGHSSWNSIASYGGQICAVANASDSGTYSASSLSDGAVWSAGALSAGSWYGLASGLGVFVTAESGGDRCATSPNGSTWAMGSMPFVADWSAVAFNGEYFCYVAAGETAATSFTGKSAISAEGYAWTDPGTIPGSGFYAICWDAGTSCWYAVSGGTLARSLNGIDWEVGCPVLYTATRRWGIATNGAGLCITGSVGAGPGNAVVAVL